MSLCTFVTFNLGKEKDGDDNTERIKNENGEKFENSKQRVNTYGGTMKNCIRKNWIDYLKLRIFWEVVLWDSKSQTVGD